MAAAETRGREEKSPPASPSMDSQQGIEKTMESPERKEPSVWHSNPLGLAETLRKREEMRMVADISHKVAMDRRNQEHSHIKVPAKIEEEKVCITVPKIILERNSALWKFALVGRFSGPRPELDRIRYWATLKWRVVGLEIIALPKGCILFNFPNQEEMLRVLLKAPWYIGGKGLLLEKWHRDYNPINEEAQMVPVWVQIPNLPLQSWDRDIISSIANVIGKIIAIDSATINRTRLIHARFCVLMRVDKPIPMKVELDMEGEKWTQDLVYETIGIRCFKCRRGGHLPQNCDLQSIKEHKQEPNKGVEEVEENDKKEEADESEKEEDEANSAKESSKGEESQEDKDTGEHQANEKKDDSQDSKENKTEQEKQDQGQGQEELQEENEQEEQDQEQEQREGGQKAEDTNQESEEENLEQEEQDQQEEQTEVEVDEPKKPRQQKKVIVQFEDNEDLEQEQEQDQVKRQEAGNKQGEEILEKQEEKEPEEEPEEYDEELIKWQKKQQKKEKRREKRRQQNEEQLRMLFPHRYPFRNRYPNDRYYGSTQDKGAERRPGRPTNQEMRERESQLAIDQGKQKTLLD